MLCSECRTSLTVDHVLPYNNSLQIRAKSLTDHNSPLVPISWSVAQQLFSLYKPKSVPEYDSYKSSTISAELEHLVKRLVALVPAHCQPDSRVESAVDSYLTDSGTLESVDQREKQQPKFVLNIPVSLFFPCMFKYLKNYFYLVFLCFCSAFCYFKSRSINSLL